MGARDGDGIAGATNVEEGEPLVPGTRQLGLSGLQVIGVRYLDRRRHEGPPWRVCGFDASGLLKRVLTPQSRIWSGSQKRQVPAKWCTATQLRISAGSRTALAERSE